MNPNTVNNERIHESLLLHKQERKGSSSKQMQTNIRGATVRTSSREVKTSGSKFDENWIFRCEVSPIKRKLITVEKPGRYHL